MSTFQEVCNIFLKCGREFAGVNLAQMRDVLHSHLPVGCEFKNRVKLSLQCGMALFAGGARGKYGCESDGLGRGVGIDPVSYLVGALLALARVRIDELPEQLDQWASFHCGIAVPD